MAGKQLVKNKNKVVVSYSIMFTVVYSAIFLPLFISGKSLVWKIDGIGQYYPAFLYIGQYLREIFTTGHIRFFDLRIAMGEDVFSALNYYGLGDPLNLIAVIATKTNGVYIFTFMFFLRLYLAGLCFILYCRYMMLDDSLSVSGAFVYLSSGYMFCACIMYSQFASPLIYFPLLLLACEKFYKEKKWWWMILVSAYAALCSVYFLYMTVLVLIPYSLIRTFYIYNKDIKKVAVNCIECGLLVVVGIILTLPVIYPAIRGILVSERSGGNALEVLSTLTYYRPRTTSILMFIKAFIPDYDGGVWFYHEIPVVSYAAVLFLFVSYFYKKNKTTRNTQLIISVTAGCIAVVMPVSNQLFSGFDAGNSYDRWIFMLEFLFAIVFVCMGSELKNRKLVCSFAIINVVLLGIILYNFTGTELTNDLLAANGIQKYTDTPANYSKIISDDNSLYRISNDSLTCINGRPENVQMINDYNGLSFWLSVVNPNTQRIANKLDGLNADGASDHRMFGLENGIVAESLAGVKYYMQHENSNFPKDYLLKESVEFYGEEWSIYENPYALPLCYSFSNEYYYEKLYKEYYANDLNVIEESNPAKDVRYDNNTITCEISCEEDSTVILSVPFSNGWMVTIDGINSKAYNSCIYYTAVNVSKGNHKIEYRYNPYSLELNQ